MTSRIAFYNCDVRTPEMREGCAKGVCMFLDSEVHPFAVPLSVKITWIPAMDGYITAVIEWRVER